MSYAETAGIAAVAGGMAEANLAVVLAFYLAIFVGFVGLVVMVVRSFMVTTTASPAAAFFLNTESSASSRRYCCGKRNR